MGSLPRWTELNVTNRTAEYSCCQSADEDVVILMKQTRALSIAALVQISTAAKALRLTENASKFEGEATHWQNSHEIHVLAIAPEPHFFYLRRIHVFICAMFFPTLRGSRLIFISGCLRRR
jgi:hypothetical protein